MCFNRGQTYTHTHTCVCAREKEREREMIEIKGMMIVVVGVSFVVNNLQIHTCAHYAGKFKRLSHSQIKYIQLNVIRIFPYRYATVDFCKIGSDLISIRPFTYARLFIVCLRNFYMYYFPLMTKLQVVLSSTVGCSSSSSI